MVQPVTHLRVVHPPHEQRQVGLLDRPQPHSHSIKLWHLPRRHTHVPLLTVHCPLSGSSRRRSYHSRSSSSVGGSPIAASQRVTSRSANHSTKRGRSRSSVGRRRTFSPSRIDSEITVALWYNNGRNKAHGKQGSRSAHAP